MEPVMKKWTIYCLQVEENKILALPSMGERSVSVSMGKKETWLQPPAPSYVQPIILSYLKSCDTTVKSYCHESIRVTVAAF